MVVGPAQAGDLVDDVEQGDGQAVAGLLVRSQCGVLVGSLVGGDHGAGEQLGVAEGVGQPMGGDRVLPRAGVTDEGPARAPRPPEMTRQAVEGPHVSGRMGGGEAVGELG